ncbi:MAG: KH domain-containing protein, partial [Sulfolobales archaeon]|nr:KH domain-containing protein [Sulfolobales archaeon]
MSEHRTVPGVTKVYLRIHEDRLGALIGEGGRVVRDLEARLGVRVTVNSVDSSVIVEPASAYTPASNIIK